MSSTLPDVGTVTLHPSEGGSETVSGATALASDFEPVVIRVPRYSLMGVAVGVLGGIASVAALYLARAFVVPLVIGVLASYALRPMVEWLKACRVPRPAGAALVLAMLVGGLSWTAYSVSDDASAMIEKLPEAARKLRQSLNAGRTNGPTALQNVRDAARELEGAAAEAAGGKTRPATRAVVGRDTESISWLRDYMLAQSTLVITVAAQAPIVVLLAYFLLASGGHFRRKLVQLVGPSLSRKKDAVRILEEIDAQVQRYLFAMLVSNSLVGVATWLAFEALGMEQAGAWGVAAGVMHFIPYLGPAAIALSAALLPSCSSDRRFMGLPWPARPSWWRGWSVWCSRPGCRAVWRV